MVTYRPWSAYCLSGCLERHDAGGIPTLDLELTAKCTHAKCIYCDSAERVNAADRDELSLETMVRLPKEAAEHGLQWVYTCGLGEPLEDPRLEALVETTSAHGASISLFSNGMLIDSDRARWLRKHHVCIILKMDTFEEEGFDRVLGIPGASKKVFAGLEALLAAGYGVEDPQGLSDLAFSIVPTSINIENVGSVVRFAKEHNIFPSVGELEQAGKVQNRTAFNELAITNDSMLELKREVEGLLWQGYVRPICPTIVTGLHIDNYGDCVVDEQSGLNCKWFLLQEPNVRVLGNVSNESLPELHRRVTEYRSACFRSKAAEIDRSAQVDYLFGGCGGSPRTILMLAKKHLLESCPCTDPPDTAAPMPSPGRRD